MRHKRRKISERAEKPAFIDYPFDCELPIHVKSVDVQDRYPEHAHSFCQIVYVARGKGQLLLSDGAFPARDGELFFIPAGQTHTFRPLADSQQRNLRLVNCIFEQKLLRFAENDHPLFGELGELTSAFLSLDRCLCVRDRSRELGRALHALQLNLNHKPTGYRYKLFVILIDLLERIHSAAGLSNPDRPIPFSDPSDDPVRRTVDHLTLCYKSPLTFEEIAAQVSISPRHLQRKFKAETGLTFIRMLQEIRIRQSCELLQNTDWSVQEVAREVGIEDMKYFYRLFREKCGMTPSEFRSGQGS